MIAVDSNVVVRFVTRDDPDQAPRAKAMLETGPVLLLRTVVLETEWVLRSIYRFDRRAIADGLSKVVGLPMIEVEDAAAVGRALAWYAHGLDFVDALHLASSGQAESFATFDRALQRKASTLPGAIRVVAAGAVTGTAPRGTSDG